MMSSRAESRRQQFFVGLVLLSIFVASALGAGRYLSRQPPLKIDLVKLTAMVRSGPHLTFVVLAPTALSDSQYAPLVRRAIAQSRLFAAREGLIFSSVGVSDLWSVPEGVALLAQITDFDEVIVGRNWINSGIVGYVNEPKARAAIPQTIVTLQDIQSDTVPHVYGERHYMVRLFGSLELRQWVTAGAPMGLPKNHTSGK